MKRATVVAGVLLLAGCSQPSVTVPVSDLKAQIDANNAAWVVAANQGDAAGVAALYTEDATMLPPGMDIQQGRAAIQKTVEGLAGSGVRNIALSALDVAQTGPDTAREIGRVTLEAPGPKKQFVKVEGKYVVIWKLVGGKWKLNVDIWNLNK
jgi:uncharacterized protein (TIGR02246 family)